MHACGASNIFRMSAADFFGTTAASGFPASPSAGCCCCGGCAADAAGAKGSSGDWGVVVRASALDAAAGCGRLGAKGSWLPACAGAAALLLSGPVLPCTHTTETSGSRPEPAGQTSPHVLLMHVPACTRVVRRAGMKGRLQIPTWKASQWSSCAVAGAAALAGAAAGASMNAAQSSWPCCSAAAEAAAGPCEALPCPCSTQDTPHLLPSYMRHRRCRTEQPR